MAVSNGGELREWRRSRGWDVPELARRLRRAADEPIAAHEGLVRMIRAWERGDHRLSNGTSCCTAGSACLWETRMELNPRQHQPDARRAPNR